MKLLTHCPACHAPTPKRPGRLLRSAAVVFAWIVAMALVFGGAVLGPMVIPIVPIWILGSIAVVSAAYRWAYADLVCEECGRLLVHEEPELLPVVAAEPPPPQQQIAA